MRFEPIGASLAVAFSLSAHAALACPCQRPTDPGGYNGYSYGTDPVSSYDGTKVRIWYTTTGANAVNPASTQGNMVPDDVVTSATVGDAALDQYAAMGFAAPLSDGGTTGCCGGDSKLDIYLMHFNAADGDTVTEGCKTTGKAQTCWSFGLVESRLDTEYGSFDLGAHIVIAHELFHSVQDAYDASLDRFWAEGTAQWAAKTLYPAEMDLEANLPAFFKNAGQSIDTSGGGVVAEYLYGSAIWPVFLTQAIDPKAVLGSLQQETQLGPPSMAAIDAALPAFGSSIADAYPTFVAWNAATGSRAGMGGYTEAATYPEVTLTPFPAENKVSDVGAGYASFFYSYDFGDASMTLTLTGDATRLGARMFPLENGKARIDQIQDLPATVTGAGVVVVAGISAKKSDAPFTLTATAPSMGTTSASSSSGSSMKPSTTGGCSCAIPGAPTPSGSLAALALFGAAFARRRARATNGR